MTDAIPYTTIDRSKVRSRSACRRGFTIVELLVVVVVSGILLAATLPRFSTALTAARIGRVSRVVASDLEAAVSLAARQRRPVRIECDCANRVLRVVDRTSGAVLRQRTLSGEQDLTVGTLSLSSSVGTASTVVFPSGLVASTLTVTVGEGSRTRAVVLNLSGAVRIN